MLTLLLYVLIIGLVAAVLFLLAGAIFGRSEELAPLPEGTTATCLPAEGITGADVRALRFQQVVRGYKAAEVDWALARLAGRIDELQTQLAQALHGTAAGSVGSVGAASAATAEPNPPQQPWPAPGAGSR
ncbi:DivIVA domain-containing protein [Nocardia panacis]|uniref:DivIVA domain-containing protein n=1 Tax=Nocardia panacis TaxID=2340916 RepID=A0A3A4KV14_9NOCA|nr:DivIVA domain-containing protein [Nocardia panacis]RJO80366.1 DivIVA domain-containing protein [Nocardia panacis]